MNTLRTALPPGVISGVLSIVASWFWMGVVFHRYQRATPQTWRVERARHYVLSSAVRFCSVIALAILYVLVARVHLAFFSEGIGGALRFAAALWIAVAAPVVIEAAIYVRLHPMVVLGQAIDWLTTSVLACVATAIALR